MKTDLPKHLDTTMRFARFPGLALVLFTLALTTFAQTDNRLAATWQVVKYDVTATLPPAEIGRELTAKAKIDLRNVSARPAASLTLRITPNATVSAVSLNGTAADFTVAEEKLGAVSLQRISIRVPSVAPAGSISATVDYKITLKDNSGLASISAADSQFLPMSFWYPTPNSWYFARGADHAPFRLMVNGGAGLTTVSGGVESAGGFEQKLNVQPFFVAGKWDTVNANGIAVLVPKGIGAAEQKRANELAEYVAEARTYFSGLLGPAPDVPIRIVSAGRGSGFHSGGTILVEKAVLSRSKLDSGTALNLAEATAKLWIGDSINVKGDGFGVIRDGLPRHLANQFIEHKYGKEIADVERTRQRIAYASVSRRDAPLNLVAPLDDYYFPAVANKGAMLWRLLSRKVGQKEFFDAIKANSTSGTISLADLRAAFSTQKDFLDQMLDQTTEMNLLVGLPQSSGGETKVAVRNTGTTDITVDVTAYLENGQSLSAPTTVRGTSYGDVVFKTPAKVSRVEIDPDKFYPQTDYSDDIAPRETTDSDLVLAVKRDFDRQAYPAAEQSARTILRWSPRFDDVRLLYARTLLAQNKLLEAEREFTAVLNEKLPTSRSLAWAAVGMADVASRTGRNVDALRFSEQAIRADADYGAGLAARVVRNKLNRPFASDESIKGFFAQFDKAAISNRKTEIDALVMPGEIARFASGITGQAVEWRSDIKHMDRLDADTALVEANMTVRLLNREVETGLAVYRLAQTPSGWKLSGVDIFEVR